MYAGKQPDGTYAVSNSPSDVVKRLWPPISSTGRNITIDNWFTSFGLVNELLKCRLTVVGTTRKNKRELPPFSLKQKNGMKNSVYFLSARIVLLRHTFQERKKL